VKVRAILLPNAIVTYYNRNTAT